MTLGSKTFFKDEPVIYFDTLTTSSLEGAATTVYAQGGRGNARLMSWDGERTVTFNMEDALISPEGIAILTGAGLIDASEKAPINVHTTENAKVEILGTNDNNVTGVEITLKNKALNSKSTVNGVTTDSKDDFIYIFPLDANGNIHTEPYIPSKTEVIGEGDEAVTKLTLTPGTAFPKDSLNEFAKGEYALVDYYVQHVTDTMQINITPDQFGSAFYIEASTLFRDEKGTDHPAEFIIPNGRIQSNFTFSLASSGDPSTFAFTVDAFPDYLRFDQSEKVLSAIQVVGASTQTDTIYAREATKSNGTGVKANDTLDLDPEPEAEG